LISIQLVSPASGDPGHKFPYALGFLDFHSISFPSEWGPSTLTLNSWPSSQISIQLVSPASGDGISDQDAEWRAAISIQLVSPASGDTAMLLAAKRCGQPQISIQLVSPASGDDPNAEVGLEDRPLGFPFN